MVNMTTAEKCHTDYYIKIYHFILYLTIMKVFTFHQTLGYNKWKFGTIWYTNEIWYHKWKYYSCTICIWPLILTSHHLINNLITYGKSYIAQSLSLREIIRKYLKMQKI